MKEPSHHPKTIAEFLASKELTDKEKLKYSRTKMVKLLKDAKRPAKAK